MHRLNLIAGAALLGGALLTLPLAAQEASGGKAKQEGKGAAKNAQREGREGAREARDGARETARDARDARPRGKSDDKAQPRDKARDQARERTRDTSKDARDTAKEGRDQARDSAKDRRDDARDSRDRKDTRDSARDTAKDSQSKGREDRDRDRDRDRTDRDTADRSDRRDDDRRDSQTARDKSDRQDSDKRSAKVDPDKIKPDDFGVSLKSADEGLTFSNLEQRSVFREAGFRRGDRIVSVGGERVARQNDFFRFLLVDNVRRDRVRVVVIRDGVEEVVFVEPAVIIRHYETVVVDDSDAAREFGLVLDDEVRNRVVVARVIADSEADHAGIREGDEILAVNDMEVQHPAELNRALERFEGDQIEMEVRRERQAKVIEAKFVR